jgi:uncharacterized protein
MTSKTTDVALAATSITHTSGLGPEDAAMATELLSQPNDSVQHLLGGLLGYWGRERLADTIAKLQTLGSSPAKLAKDPAALVDLKFLRLEPPQGRGAPLAVFSYRDQKVGRDIKNARSVFMQHGKGKRATGSLAEVDVEERQVKIRWTTARAEDGFYPNRVLADDWVNPAPKPAVLSYLARQVLDGREINPVTRDLLTAASPRFKEGHGPSNGIFSDDLQEAQTWVTQIDNSYVAVQGPPGAGKTYMGAHLIYTLIAAGQRVGITAMSHSATENLLEATVALFAERGEMELLHAVKKSSEAKGGIAGVSYVAKNADAANPYYNLVAGTTWLFASDAMLENPVDTLVVDEAGQLSLADAVVASVAAKNVLLLGDPQQLAQVTQAQHPGSSGNSVLEHVLGGEGVIANDRGVFLSTTRRMHPEVASYISDQFYGGRLGSHESCALQNVETQEPGLYYLEAKHTGNVTESQVEAEIVKKRIVALLGKKWTDVHGVTQKLGVKDFMVVAPFNDQVDLLRSLLDSDKRTHGVPVGTVDKFQGREAAVVFFTMTTSSRDEMMRGVEFLFSPNRLNVAVSRARCAVYLVGTKALLETKAGEEDPATINVTNFVARSK